MTVFVPSGTLSLVHRYARYRGMRPRFSSFCLPLSFTLQVLQGKADFIKLSDLHRLAGLVVKASASRAEDPGFESRLRRDFSGSSHTSDLKIDFPVATLPGA